MKKKNLILLTALLALAGLLYLPGLDGGLLFDDRINLEPLALWNNGEISWQEVAFGNSSGPLGRPVSMISFLLNIAITGDSVIGLKAGNLLLHLLTGVLLFWFMHALVIRDQNLVNHYSWAPLALTAVWLLHPMMVGTVLYVVQRMAILSAFFTLATLLAFIHGRSKIEIGSWRTGSAWLFIAVPLLTVLAALSKENGLLALLLCGVIEWVYFMPQNAARRPTAARLFVLLFIGLPLAGALLLLLLQPGFYFDGYANRPFEPLERVLTQTRVLFDYVGKLLIPVGSTFSLLRDDYQISNNLFSPLTTLFSVLGWVFLVTMAILLRRRVPGFSAGIGIFLVGHGMESTIFPLLIYFEHRNYLPAIGIILSVAALLAAAGHYLRTKLEHPRRVLQIGIFGLLIALAVATFARATVWSSNEALIRESLENYPSSVHLLMELQHILMTKSNPDVGSARELSRQLLRQERPSTQLIGMLNLIRIDCLVDGETSPPLVKRAFEIQPETVQADLFTTFDALGNVLIEKPCVNLTAEQLADEIVEMVEQQALPSTLIQLWRLRFLGAKLYYSEGKLSEAYSQARAAWSGSGNSPTIGLMVLGLQINLDMLESASQLYGELEKEIKPSNYRGRSLLEQYGNELDRKLLHNGKSRADKFSEL